MVQRPGRCHGPVGLTATVLLDQEGVDWWVGSAAAAAVPPPSLWCGSCRAWLALEQAGLDARARWLGPLGASAWNALQLRVGAWHAALAAVPRLPAGAPPAGALAELLCGDLFSPALLGLALLPDWLEPLLGAEQVILPIGARLRAPGPGRGLGDLPLLLLAALLRQRGVAVEMPAVLGRFDPPDPSAAGVRLEAGGAAVEGPCLWLAIGKLRHPEIPLLAFEATGLAVRLVETEAAAPLPDLFADAPRFRGLATAPVLLADPAAAAAPPLPPAGAEAPAGDWLEALAGWSLLQAIAGDLAADRLELDHRLAAAWRQDRPRLLLVPEENSRGCERLVMQARSHGVPHGALHHTAELLPLHSPGRWQRHLEDQDPLLVPLRAGGSGGGGGGGGGDRAVLSADPVRAHLLEGLELEASLPLPAAPAVGWLHYPLQQQSLLPLADPLAYWQALGGVEQALRDRGVPLLLARKPPLEPAGLADARAQGLDPAAVPGLRPLAALLAESWVVVAPGHLGTGHLEAIARGRAVVVVLPARLARPSLLLEPEAPLPVCTPEAFPAWFAAQDPPALRQLAAVQAEWLRGRLLTTTSLADWLALHGVATKLRQQRFLGSGLLAQRPLLDRVERLERFSRRLGRLRASRLGRGLVRLKRWLRP